MNKTINSEIPCIVDGSNKPLPIIAIWANSITGWKWIATSKPYPETDPTCYYGFVYGLADEWGTFDLNFVERQMEARRIPKSAWHGFNFVVWADKDKLENGV